MFLTYRLKDCVQLRQRLISLCDKVCMFLIFRLKDCALFDNSKEWFKLFVI